MEKAIDSDQYEVSIELTVDASGSTCKKKKHLLTVAMFLSEKKMEIFPDLYVSDNFNV